VPGREKRHALQEEGEEIVRLQSEEEGEKEEVGNQRIRRVLTQLRPGFY
jgi:hypothetical protein